MAIEIQVPNEAFSQINITLSGFNYSLIFKYNSEDDRLYFDLYLEQELIKSGIKIMENQSLLSRYLLDGFDHGDIQCVKKEETVDQVTLGNVGINLPYGLFYATNEELGI